MFGIAAELGWVHPDFKFTGHHFRVIQFKVNDTKFWWGEVIQGPLTIFCCMFFHYYIKYFWATLLLTHYSVSYSLAVCVLLAIHLMHKAFVLIFPWFAKFCIYACFLPSCLCVFGGTLEKNLSFVFEKNSTKVKQTNTHTVVTGYVCVSTMCVIVVSATGEGNLKRRKLVDNLCWMQWFH